ncbi:MAG: ribosome biogenesis GTPase YlqF [Myxococcota bacterium]
MPIHWFPGHMATARREIREAMPEVDFVLEVLDARIPFSSENPLVAELRGERPCIRILNKSDLADPEVTAQWLARMSERPGMVAFSHHHREGGLLRKVTERAEVLLADRRLPPRPRVAMILGVPNVGKSTLINTLAGRPVARAADKPAVTQQQQRVAVSKALTLLDTPGFLWPKLSPEACGYRLAVTGAISDRVVDLQALAAFAARTLAERYPRAIAACYELAAVPAEDVALLEAIGRRRGFLGKGGVVDLQRASERLIRDLRAGNLGRVSLETPADCLPR